MNDKNKNSTRIFSDIDQSEFSLLSGDYNPLHLDSILARRLIFGSKVVHGINLLLWSLNVWLDKKKMNIELSSINVEFLKPVNVGQKVNIKFNNLNNNIVIIRLFCEHILTTKINFCWLTASRVELDFIKFKSPPISKPKVIKEKDLDKSSGELNFYLNEKIVKKNYPSLSKYFSKLQIAIFLSSTRLIGNKCPGLNSIYSNLNLNFKKNKNYNNFNYNIKKVDRRFSLVLLNIFGPSFDGLIKSFIRPDKLKTIKFNIIKKVIKKSKFNGQNAIIIGGSRGIGEVTTKLLSAGSANVKFSFNSSEKEAFKITNDINKNGGKVSYFQYNILSKKNKMLKSILKDFSPTHLYYFATPFIFIGSRGSYSKTIYEKFYQYYVVGFENTLSCLIDKGLKKVFYPSTVAIDQNPPDMQEYITAKREGEKLCNSLEKKHSHLEIYKPRLPRIETDQTVSLFSVKNENPISVQLEHLNIFNN